MGRTRNFRARTTYENKNRLMEAATELNGAEPRGFHQALELVTTYIDVLYDDVTHCVECGERLEKKSAGTWYCWLCNEEGDTGYYNVWDILDSDDPDAASIPGLPQHVKLEFECDCDDERAGMILGERRQDANSRADTTTKTVSNRRDGPLDW